VAQVGCGYSRPGSLSLLLEPFDLTSSLRQGYRVGWLNDETGVREARGSRVRDPADAAADPVAAHLRERSGEPVHTDLAKRGWRCERGQRCRAAHALRKPERPTIPPAPRPMDTRTASALGSISLPTLLLRRLASFGRAAVRASVYPKGSILRVSSETGFILAGGRRHHRCNKNRTRDSAESRCQNGTHIAWRAAVWVREGEGSNPWRWVAFVEANRAVFRPVANVPGCPGSSATGTVRGAPLGGACNSD